MSEGHQEALAHLVYGINSDGGFVLLTGEVGTGKTTVCRCLLEQVPGDSDIAFILNPKLTTEELLATICDELGIGCPQGNTSIKVFVDRINTYLLDAHARGRRTVLIIEEAQNLSPDVLEQVRLLTNLETDKRKLLQIIMLGQPELADMLSRPELRQLAQRITARYHLGPLSKKDVSAYVAHRLSVAEGKGPLFPDPVVGRIFKLSNGIPRLVNVLCDRALLGAYVQGKENVDIHTVNSAAAEVFGTYRHRLQRYHGKKYRLLLAGLFIIICIFSLAAAYVHYRPGQTAATMAGPQAQDIAPRTAADKGMPWLVSPRQQRQSIRAVTWTETKRHKGRSPRVQGLSAHTDNKQATVNTVSSGINTEPFFTLPSDIKACGQETIPDEKQGGN
jgi:general secretion pathway protein A